MDLVYYQISIRMVKRKIPITLVERYWFSGSGIQFWKTKSDTKIKDNTVKTQETETSTHDCTSNMVRLYGDKSNVSLTTNVTVVEDCSTGASILSLMCRKVTYVMKRVIL